MELSAQTMRRYLLGELSESEQSALEEQYFSDPQVFNQVVEAESELLDSYARGKLSTATQERVEQFYLAHPARAERAKFAAALTTRLDQSEPGSEALSVSWWQGLLRSLRGQNPALRLSMALVALLIVAGTVWVIFKRQQRQQEARQTLEAQQRLQRESQQDAEEARRAKELTDERERIARTSLPTPEPTPTPANSQNTVTLALALAAVRSGDGRKTPTLIIPTGTIQARLLLNLNENSYPGYSARLQTIAGVEILNQPNLKPRSTSNGVSFAFTVPASKLQSGDYVLTLSGVSRDGESEDLGKSLFRVERR